MVYVALIDTSEIGVSLLSNDNMIMGFVTVKDGLDFFEKGYRKCHETSYESSMSACVNYMSFRPSIVEFKDLDDLVDKLSINKDNFQRMSISNVSGYMEVFKIPNQENAKQIWESGNKPKLV